MNKPSETTRAWYIEQAFSQLREAAIHDGMDNAVREVDRILTDRGVTHIYCQRCDGEGKWVEQGPNRAYDAVEPSEKVVKCPDCLGTGHLEIKKE